RFDTCRRSTLSCWRRTKISATSFVLGLKNEAMIWRISRRNSIIKWQRYRVSASRLAESNFWYRQDGASHVRTADVAVLDYGAHRSGTMAGGSYRDLRSSINCLRLCLAAARCRSLRRRPLHHGGLLVHGFDFVR